jgi:uncharacterized damage-inducible protein DinB
MYRSIADFEQFWQMETAKTVQLFRNLTDESLSQRIAEGHETLGGLAWHLAVATSTMLSQTGLEIPGPGRGDPVPSSAAEITAAYERAAAAVPVQVAAAWTDDGLPEAVPFYGRTAPRGIILQVLILHQTHHRGQMTVLMRQAGLRVPGMYGPSKEEWEAMSAAAATAP